MIFKWIWRFTEKTIGGKMEGNSVKKNVRKKDEYLLLWTVTNIYDKPEFSEGAS